MGGGGKMHNCGLCIFFMTYKESDPEKQLKRSGLWGVPWQPSSERIWRCHYCGLGQCCDVGLLSGPGTSMWQKKKKRSKLWRSRIPGFKSGSVTAGHVTNARPAI